MFAWANEYESKGNMSRFFLMLYSSLILIFPMSSTTKSLLTIWGSSFFTFAVLALYMLPRQEDINALGELGENFATGAFLVLEVLVVASFGVVFLTREKQGF